MPPLATTRFDELKATNQLPSPTGVALAILRLADSEKSTVQEITRILQSDPALCGRLLKITNSAFSACARPVASVREAVTQLGVRRVRNIALSFSLVSQYGRGICDAFDYAGFWSRSLAMGVAAQAGAQAVGGIAPQEAFTCGLLAQVGRLALATVYPVVYQDILASLGKGGRDELRRLERQLLAADHGELTVALLRDWGLPDTYVLAVERHENPEAATLSRAERVLILTRLLEMASRMADVCLSPSAERADRVPELVRAGEAAGINPPDLLALCDRVVGEWQDWGRIFQVKTQEMPRFAELALRAGASREQGAVPIEVSEDTSTESRLRIVAVDDDAAGVQQLTQQLLTAGHTVHAARSADEALCLVVDINPQIVIAEWQMPKTSGLGLVRSLRQTKMGRQLYIIMMTANETEDAQVEAFAAGADDFLVKPLRPKLLAARLRACTRIVHLRDEVGHDKEQLQRCMKELAVANRKLQEAALTDALTGLYNRRFALERLEQEWTKTTHTGQTLACLLGDIDHFKRVNDTHGHDVGDRVLQATAEVLRAKLRSSDVACRLGGEEFLILGPGMNPRVALACAERLRAQVQAQQIETSNGPIQITMSIGVAVRTATMKNAAELLKCADEAVYKAKAEGRNAVRLAAALELEPADLMVC